MQKTDNLIRQEIHISGIVQGVGFRPFVYNLARHYDITGLVYNDSRGVFIEAEGDEEVINAFIDSIRHKHPPQAFIEYVSTKSLNVANSTDFIIDKSKSVPTENTWISPDMAICEDCLSELYDPADRRYLYPFINCTNCGPRLTVVKDIPYDRCKTTMSKFSLCPDCQKEYDDPTNRRFHTQTTCCPACGPHLTLVDNKGEIISNDDNEVLKLVSEYLKQNKIVAIKGIGGYHISCTAIDDRVVEQLRHRKRRQAKPFAIMCKDIKQIKSLCYVSKQEEILLTSIKSPVVILKRKPGIDISEHVSAKQKTLGVMLPYTPLHHLILNSVKTPLVMTSGNVSSEAIYYKDKEAIERLSDIADFFLINDREIQTSIDDAVVKIVNDREYLIRRSRGYAPRPLITNTKATKEILACGSDMKNTITLFKDNKLFVSHFIGDLSNYTVYNNFEEAIKQYQNIFKVNPELVVHDLHPSYYSSEYGRRHSVDEKIEVQHHHAHIVSCMVDNNYDEPVIGVCYDGTGYGSDGNVWGGEFLLADKSDFKRLGHLAYFDLPGGDISVKKPAQITSAMLYRLFGNDYLEIDIPFSKWVDKRSAKILHQLIDNNINIYKTSSIGRLFDLVSALLLVCTEMTYDGQPAVELEAIANDTSDCYIYDLHFEFNMYTLYIDELISSIVNDLCNNVSLPEISGKFHNTIVRMTVDTVNRISRDVNLNTVALSGGVWMNDLLLHKVIEKLTSMNYNVLYHTNIPTNDECISVGQAIIANERFR